MRASLSPRWSALLGAICWRSLRTKIEYCKPFGIRSYEKNGLQTLQNLHLQKYRGGRPKKPFNGCISLGARHLQPHLAGGW